MRDLSFCLKMLYYATGTLLSFYSNERVPDILIARINNHDIIFTQLYDQDNIFYYVCPAYPEYEQYSGECLSIRHLTVEILSTRQIYGVFTGLVPSDGLIYIGNYHTSKDRVTLYLYFPDRVDMYILDLRRLIDKHYQLVDYLPDISYVILIE